MKKTLVIIMLISFGCSLALAIDDAHISNSKFKIEKKDVTKTTPVVAEKTTPSWIKSDDNPEKSSYLSKPTIKKSGAGSIPQKSNDNLILDIGNTCDDPIIIDEIRYSDEGYSCDFSDDCDINGHDSYDIFYKIVVEEETEMVVSLVGSDYDTQLAIYQGECCGEDYWAYNDDYNDEETSQLTETFTPATYYIVVDGYEDACGNYVLTIESTDAYYPTCPDVSLYSQEVIGPDDEWEAYPSDDDGDNVVFDNFEFDSGTVGGIVFTGININSENNENCYDDPFVFNIGFYEDDEGVPGSEVASYTVEPTTVETSYLYYYGYYTLFEFTASLPSSVALTEGWVSITSVGENNDCTFCWMNGNDGDDASYVLCNDTLYTLEYDFSMCIIPGVEEGNGDDCYGPIFVDSIPFSDEGYSCNFDDNCDVSGTDAEDVIYKLDIDSDTYLIASLYGSNYDTKLAVYRDECCSGEYNYFLFSDDYYSDYTSEVRGLFPSGTYYIVVDGYDADCGSYALNIYEYEPTDPGCFHDYVDPSGDWIFSTSDVEIGPYKLFDNFSCEDDSVIYGITYWGADLHFDRPNWYECDDNATTMDISFYPNADDGKPDIDNPICVYENISPSITYTGEEYSGNDDTYELKQYDVVFDQPCSTNSGWVSIQATSNNSDTCVFTWLNSFDGDTLAYSYSDGIRTQIYYDYSFQFQYTVVGIDDETSEVLPTTIDMLSCYPNPFNPTTTISFSLANSGDVTIDIYNILGRRIDKLNLGYLASGQAHSVAYNASSIATGVYFYSLVVDGQTKVTERFSLLK